MRLMCARMRFPVQANTALIVNQVSHAIAGHRWRRRRPRKLDSPHVLENHAAAGIDVRRSHKRRVSDWETLSDNAYYVSKTAHRSPPRPHHKTRHLVLHLHCVLLHIRGRLSSRRNEESCTLASARGRVAVVVVSHATT